MNEKVIAVIDMKAFYASIECVERGLDPFSTPLAVTDITRKEATIVLSVSPYLKELGVPSRCRRKDLPSNIEGLIYAPPQMEKYVKISAEIVSIFLDFVGLDDIHIYSIDESFLDLTPYLKLYKCSPYELAKKILNRVYEKTKLPATCGLGSNMFLAKVADDIYAKKSKDFIGTLYSNEIKEKLYPITPLNKIWGISNGYLTRLNKLGIYKVEDLAKFDLELLKKEFGILGEELYNHANGLDDTNIRDKYIPINKALSNGQVLLKDYNYKNAKLILKEMNDELAFRLREINRKTNCVHLYIGYSLCSNEVGFAKNMTLSKSTNNTKDLFDALNYLYDSYIEDKPIRRIGISYSNLVISHSDQLSLFKDLKEEEIESNMFNAFDEIQNKYGKDKLLRLTSKDKDSTIKERHNQIGGHRR